MTVRHLLLKTRKGAPVQPRERIELDPTDGVVGGVRSPPLRHVLLLSSADLREFKLSPGDFRENAVLDFDELNGLPSGTEIQIGTARIRLTFHCEPCSRVARYARPSELLHRRGYLGSVSAGGSLRVGDSIAVLGRPFAEIPYKVQARLKWYLEACAEPIDASSLLWELGLSPSYARALPALLRSLPASLQQKVRFKRRAAHSRDGARVASHERENGGRGVARGAGHRLSTQAESRPDAGLLSGDRGGQQSRRCQVGRCSDAGGAKSEQLTWPVGGGMSVEKEVARDLLREFLTGAGPFDKPFPRSIMIAPEQRSERAAGPLSAISDSQAVVLQQLVRDLNARYHVPFQTIWTLVNRHTGVSGYRHTPASRFDDAACYLQHWIDTRLPPS